MTLPHNVFITIAIVVAAAGFADDNPALAGFGVFAAGLIILNAVIREDSNVQDF